MFFQNFTPIFEKKIPTHFDDDILSKMGWSKPPPRWNKPPNPGAPGYTHLSFPGRWRYFASKGGTAGTGESPWHLTKMAWRLLRGIRWMFEHGQMLKGRWPVWRNLDVFVCCFKFDPWSTCRLFFGKKLHRLELGKGIYTIIHIGVSKNRGTPKWMVYNGKPYWNGWFGGTTIFGNTHIRKWVIGCDSPAHRLHQSHDAFSGSSPFSEWREPSKAYYCLKRRISNHV